MWREILISSGHPTWALNFYTTLRQKYSYDTLWGDSPIAVSCRQLIVQLCSLAGSVFPNGIYSFQTVIIYWRSVKCSLSIHKFWHQLDLTATSDYYDTTKHNPYTRPQQFCYIYIFITDGILVRPPLPVAPAYTLWGLGECIQKYAGVVPHTMRK
jgi:hypothetical protein